MRKNLDKTVIQELGVIYRTSCNPSQRRTRRASEFFGLGTRIALCAHAYPPVQPAMRPQHGIRKSNERDTKYSTMPIESFQEMATTPRKAIETIGCRTGPAPRHTSLWVPKEFSFCFPSSEPALLRSRH
jgi:hypothetical protein